MSRTIALATSRGLSLRERIAWRHPEWWSLALSVLAWIALAGDSAAPIAAGHEAHGLGQHAIDGAGIRTVTQWTAAVTGWTLMVVAMMFPLAIGPIRTTAERSLWRRRHRAIAEFLTGYSIAWVAAGALGASLVAGLSLAIGMRPHLWTAGALALAAVWQLTPIKRRALRACHRTAPLAGGGWRADRDCVVYGATIGGRCLVSCWPMMLACLVSAHSVPVMMAATTIGVAERYASRSVSLRTSGVLGLLACLHAGLA